MKSTANLHRQRRGPLGLVFLVTGLAIASGLLDLDLATAAAMPRTPTRTPHPVIQDHLPTAGQIELERTRTRLSFSGHGDPRRGPAPFQDLDLSDQTKQNQAGDAARVPAAALTPEIRARIDALTDPHYLRTLRRGADPSRYSRGPACQAPTRATSLSTAQRDQPWTADRLLANPTNMNDEYVSLAESPLTGDLYAMFAAKDLGGTDRDIHVARSGDDGQTWQVWELPSFSEDEFHPELAIDGGGYLHATWIREDGYILRCRSTGPDSPHDWGSVRGLGTGEACATPAIAVNGAGDFSTVFIAAAWLTINWDLYQYEWTLIFMASTNGGQTINYDYFLPDGYPEYWPDVAISGGTVHFINAEADYYTGETEILIATDAVNGSFSEPASLTGFTPDNCGFPQLACENDDVFVVYQMDYTDGLTTNGDIIYTFSWDAGSSFYGPYGLVADDYESVGPTLLVRNGVVGCVWLDAPENADEFHLAARLGSGYGQADLFGPVELVSEEPRVEPAFHSAYGLATGERIHAAWVDRRDFATEGHNIYVSSRDVAANLGMFRPVGWDSSLVANMVRGERATGWLAAGDTTFVSFALQNNGLADIAETFNVELLVDGAVNAAWAASGGLPTGQYVTIEDHPLVLTAGQHTLAVRLDGDDFVAESSEDDNGLVLALEWIEGEPLLRFNPSRLVKTIMPEQTRQQALVLKDQPLLRRQVHLPVIDSRLAEAMAMTRDDELLRVMVVPALRIDPTAMGQALADASVATRREVILAAARNHTDRVFGELSATLHALAGSGRGGEPRPLWLSQTIAMKMNADAVAELALQPGIGQLWLDDQKSTTFGAPGTAYAVAPMATDSRANAWHIAAIGADEAWARGQTGEGILVGHLDTGIAYDHPDLAGHLWDGGSEYPHHGYDTVDDDNDPYDGDSFYHGTHTSGLIVGDGSAGTTCGAAPGAVVMPLRALPGYMDDLIEALQFGLDHGVDLFNLSGGWQQASDATRAANRYNAELFLSIEVPWICSAGNGDNYGGHYPPPADIVSPGDSPSPWYAPNGGHTAVVAVGAVDQYQEVWAYSSHGPTAWDVENTYGDTDYHDYPYTPGLIKPDLSAPGDLITSCTGGGAYVIYSGTSMSCPLVTGAMCILMSAAGEATVAQLCEALETTALDLRIAPAGPGRDNFTGAGLIDIPAALENLPLAEPETFWICNDGELPLVPGTPGWSSSWLDVNLPGGAIDPGDSLRVTALFDPDLLAEGVYHDTIVLTSNAPDSPHSLPVTFVYGASSSPVDDELPALNGAKLSNHPNPFNPRTVLRFAVHSGQRVRLEIYDLRGRCVRHLVDDPLSVGTHEVVWNGQDDRGQGLASGQYVARLVDGPQAAVTRKLMLVR